ncbi:M67 family metallopeptidase [Paenibacillus endoradicis]|uniref:M67 family metallopeptidase n=1 Tax=Paenibacillus endoradicis TaxID=2972487 RepID=UPI002158FCF0|nr:M67 family metallopeptidase [Paenibacillus endoradicis]MCR8656819.1 M67 family metallopeptidase [Paenibacillus endoradicis]
MSTEHISAIYQHGQEDYPYECCGVVIGELRSSGEKIVKHLQPIINEREDEAKHNRFLISADSMLKSELHAQKLGLDVLGFYHSHPDHPAIPSSFDQEHAWPTYSYLIVSVIKGESNELTSWELLSDRTAFQPETIREEN